MRQCILPENIGVNRGSTFWVIQKQPENRPAPAEIAWNSQHTEGVKLHNNE